MNRNDIAFLIVRVTAIYACLEAFGIIGSSWLAMDFAQLLVPQTFSWALMGQVCVPFLALLSLSLILLAYTPQIARYLVPASPGEAANSSGPLIATSVVVGAVGIVNCLERLSGLIDVITAWLPSEADGDAEGPATPAFRWLMVIQIIGQSLPFLLSLLLIFKAHAFARWWDARDAMGVRLKN
jgi:hypothetical protein